MKETEHWHNLTIQETYTNLNASYEGLSVSEAENRLLKYGPNEIDKGKGISKLEILLAQVKNPLVYILLIAAAISLVSAHYFDAIVIGVIIIVNSLIGFTQEYRAEEALEALMSAAAPEAEVVRQPEGKQDFIEMRVPTSALVPGDIILLNEGSKVPADSRLIEAFNLEVDEAMLTGESFSVGKTTEPITGEQAVADRKNLVYSGTVVTRGRGRAIVYATGTDTEMGEIATLIRDTEKAVSPLRIQTEILGKNLGLLALSVAILTIVIGLITALGFQEIFMFALASAVSSIPEGLPAVMSITLALGVSHMAKRNAIIRRLPAVDTLGVASVICSDKTGTLTTNKMTVEEIHTGNKDFTVTGTGFRPNGEFLIDNNPIDPCSNPDLTMALTIGALCNNARLFQLDGTDDWEIRGDPTEAALIVAATKADCFKETLEKQFERIDEIPFSSNSKYMVTFNREDAETVNTLVKGAPEIILSQCKYIQISGEIIVLTPEKRDAIVEMNHQLAEKALRVLGMAYKTIPEEQIEAMKEKLEKAQDPELVFVGLTGMMDPPRPEVFEAIERCNKAGVRVMMATGDHQITARAIAEEIGLLSERGRVVTGAEMDKLDDQGLDAILEETSVFARVAPEHKHRLVGSLQRHGYVVAMTGDGVNDAPALQAAEIGVAMGISGTDVTKETAEMILTDDNFASIVNAVEEGRYIFTNVRKVIKFLLSTNVGEDLTLLTSLILFAGQGLIISPVQILWVNLVTDGILDITLAMEPKEKELMDEPPRAKNARIINREILFNILIVALVMAAGTLFMYHLSAGRIQAYRQTIVFTTMAMFQVFNAFNCRSRTQSFFSMPFFSNPYLIIAIFTSVFLQFLAVHVPLMQSLLGTAPLSLGDWAMVFLVASSIFFVDEIRKLIQRKIQSKPQAVRTDAYTQKEHSTAN